MMKWIGLTCGFHPRLAHTPTSADWRGTWLASVTCTGVPPTLDLSHEVLGVNCHAQLMSHMLRSLRALAVELLPRTLKTSKKLWQR